MAVAGLALGAVGEQLRGEGAAPARHACARASGRACVACSQRRTCACVPRRTAVGAGVVYLLESPTSPVPYSTSRETPHEAGPLKGILQGIPDLMWPENKNPFAPDGPYYEHKVRPSCRIEGMRRIRACSRACSRACLRLTQVRTRMPSAGAVGALSAGPVWRRPGASTSSPASVPASAV